MASTPTDPAFGRVSRLRGLVFKNLTFAASLTGLLLLGILLVYVSIDAFGLDAADPLWVVLATACVIVPVLGLWLYSAGDREVTTRVLAAVGGGLPAAFLVDRGLELVGLGLPNLDWALLWLFGLVFPATSYAIYAGSQEPVGAVGSGLVGRAVAGCFIGVVTFAMFVVYDPTIWVLIYTLSVLPYVLLRLLAARRNSTVLDLAPAFVGILGFVASVPLSNLLVFYVLTWVLYVWSIAMPAAALVGWSVAKHRGRRTGAAVGLGAFVVPVVGSLAAGALTRLAPRHALLLLVPLSLLTGLFALRVLWEREGRLGLIAPFVLIGGVVAAWLLTGAVDLAGPATWFDWQFLTSSHSREPERAGLYPAIIGSIAIISIVAILSFGFGVGVAIFLEDYMSDEGVTGWIVRLIQINIANLAAVPSIVYGLLGLAIFINLRTELPSTIAMGPVSVPIPFGGMAYTGFGMGTVLTAALTLSLLILPVTIIASQEAIRAVPDSLRQGSYAMGATRWQTTKNVVLPEAMPGILTGTILALGRAIGETAPLLVIGLSTTAFTPPSGFSTRTTAMPMQVFAWHDLPGPEFQHGVLAAGVVTMLLVLLVMNGAAIVLRNRYESEAA